MAKSIVTGTLAGLESVTVNTALTVVPAFRHRDIGDRQARVVVDDRAGGLQRGRRGELNVVQVELEGLVRFDLRLADDLHRDLLAGLARLEGERAGGADIVGAGNRGDVGRVRTQP